MSSSSKSLSLRGAAFLMATSAIGPGFITQTVVFTQKLGADFGFIILCSLLIDVIVQVNIWRTLFMTKRRAGAVCNTVLPHSGVLVSLMVVAGGLVFNMGNIGGCGLGLAAFTNLPVGIGAGLSAALAIVLFLYRQSSKAMDAVAQVMGFIMIALVVLTAIITKPELLTVAKHTILPQRFDALATLTLVGGTVGGYISFSGAHRMVEQQRNAASSFEAVRKWAIIGIVISGIMRFALYLAAFGVVNNSALPVSSNPAAAIFQQALGEYGLRIFGLVFWCAAITSVIGASYTSVSFLEDISATVAARPRWATTIFIVVSAALYLIIGQPVKLLVAAGLINSFVLPIALSLLLLAAKRFYVEKQFPALLYYSGWIAVVMLTGLAVFTVINSI